MKLGKDEIQKIVLGSLLLLALIYSYFNFLLGPLELRQNLGRKAIADLDPQIKAANAQIKKTEKAEVAAPKARVILAQVDAMIPDGSPVAWFPQRIGEFFRKRGVDKVATRLNNENEDKNLPGFRRISWGIDLPKVDFIPFAMAIAELENEEPLVTIATLQVDVSRDEPGAQHTQLTVQNIVKQ